MAWPDDLDLPVEIHAAFGADVAASPGTWSWTNLSSRLLADPIRLRVGKSGGAANVSPGTCAVTLDNDDGALTPLHPISPYWPNVELGTPLRVRVQVNGVWHERFAGFADQWEPTYLPTGVVGQMVSAMRVTASGSLRRLTQGTPPSLSPMRRTLAASGALAYWPIEDGTDAGQVASAFSGHSPLSITGAVTFSPIDEWTESRGYEVRYGTAALADISAGAFLTAPVPASVKAATATAAGWTVAVAADVGTLSALSADLVLLEVHTPGGTFVRWRMLLTKTNRTQIIGYTGGGTATWVVDDPSSFGAMVPHSMTVFQDGAGVVRAGFAWDSVTGYEGTGSVPGTVAGVTAVSINPTAVTSSVPVPVGHLAVWAGHDLPVVNMRDGNMILALFGYSWTNIVTGSSAPTGERATVRLARLAAEDGVTINMPSVSSADDELMGKQPDGTALELYRECEAADLGILYEDGFDLAYLPRVYRYNRPVDLTVDLAAYRVVSGDSAGVLKPVYDDQGLRNDMVVSRRDGSSVVATDPDSQRLGVYGDSVELNLASDDQLPDQASWRVHLVSEPDLRERTFPLDLAANPGLVDGWLSCQVGSRIVRTNPPAQHRPGPLDRVVDGWTETIGPRSWMVLVNPAPASPWTVAAVDGDARISSDGSVLAAALSSSATTAQVVSTLDDGPWTTDVLDLPLDMRIGGERVTADGARVVDVFDRTGSGGFGGPWAAAMGSSAAFSTDGARGIIALTGTGRFGTVVNLGSADQENLVSIRSPVTATGGPIVVGWMARYLDTENHLYVEAEFRPDGRIWLGLYARIASVNSTVVSPVNVMAYSAGSTYRLGVRTVGDVFQARVYPGGTPPAYQVTGSAAVPLPVTATWAGPRAILAGTNTNTQPVLVTYDNVDAAGAAFNPAVYDTFTRSTGGGWGSTDTGQSWAVSGGVAGDYTTDTARGVMSQGSVGVLRTALLNLGVANATFAVDIPLTPTPTGASNTYWLLGRVTDLSNHYIARLEVPTSGNVQLALFKRVGGSLGGLGPAVSIAPNIGGTWRVVFGYHGSVLRAKAWRFGVNVEPGWLVEAVDTSLTSGTLAGVGARLETGNTSALPVLGRFDNFTVLSPQTVALFARSVNGVTRSWPAGTDVDVWAPAYAAL